MSETVRLSNFASIANAVFNSVSANATSITGISVGGAVINATSLSAATNTFTVGTAAFFVANGNLGIGTSSPVQPLQVNANIRATAGGTNSIAEIRGGNADGAVIQLFRAGNTSQFAGFAQFQGSLFIKNVDSGPTIFTTTTGDVERMRISADGNVGIGVSNPTYRLSTLFAAGTQSPSALTRGAVLSTSYTRNDNSEFVSRQISVGATQYAAVAQAEDFNLNAMPLAINPNGGNVGIGTSTPGGRLNVSSNRAAIAYSQVWTVLNGGSFENDVILGYQGTHTFFGNFQNNPLTFVTNNLERMRITAAGNVGIGTSTPGGRLHVVGPANSTPFSVSGSISSIIWQEFVTAGAAFNYMWNNNGTLFFGTNSNHSLQLATNSIERMRISAAGELLVGTTAVAASDWFTTTPVGVFSADNNGQLRVHRPSTGNGVGAGAVLFAASDGSGNQRDIAVIRCETTAVNAGGGVLAFLTRPNSGSLTERARITSTGDFQFNSGYGSVTTAFGCRAWVNFNGTGTVAIRSSGNISSITDLGTGDYTANFSTAMPDINYSQVWTAGVGAGVGLYLLPSIFFAPTVNGCGTRVTTDGAAITDAAFVCLAVFR